MATGKIIQADKIQGLADVPNFLSNPNGLLNTSGWTEGSYTAGSKPTGNFTASSGAGAFTIGRTTTNPLGMTGTSLVFTKSSGNQQGRAVETIFALPLDYRAKVLKLSASYINTSTNATDFVAGSDTTDSDMIFYTAYSTDGGTTYTVAEPSSFKLLSNSKDNSSPYDGTYQTPYNATHLKLIAYVATTSTTAWSIKAVLGVSPSQYVYGAPISDWQSYTPTITGLGSGSATFSRAIWRRVGDSVQVDIRLSKDGSAGTGSSAVEITLPPGLSVDLMKANSNNFGAFAAYSNNSTVAQSNVTSYVTTTSKIAFTNGIATALGSDFQANTVWTATVSVPILGWSSSVQMSDGYDGRVVAARIRANNSTTPLTLSGTFQTIKFPTVVRDEVNGYDPVTGIYTVPTSGWYRATASAGFNLSGTTVVGEEIARLNLVIGNASFIDQGSSITTTATLGKSPLIASGINYLTAGQGIRVEARYSGGVSSGNITIYGDGTNLSIEKLSGSPTISASETVALMAINQSGQSVDATISTITNWNTPLISTHGSFDKTNGIFTVNSPGIYFVHADLTVLSSAGDLLQMYISHTGTGPTASIDAYKIARFLAAGAEQLAGGMILNANAGDMIRLQCYSSPSRNLEASFANKLNIFKVK